MTEEPLLRIGALSRETGVAVSTLRSWESRYGLPTPARTAGGHRLYSRLSVEQVLEVQNLVAGGASTSAAAASVLAERREADRLAATGNATVPLQELLLRTRAAKAESHRLRTELSMATAAAVASLGRLHTRTTELQAGSR